MKEWTLSRPGVKESAMQHCRYLLEEGNGEVYCAYWDLPLLGDEDLRCHPGGWECYEEPGGCIFEGRWMSLTEYAEYLESKSEREIPEGYEIQEFRLDREGMADLSAMTGEFHCLKLRADYPKEVKMVALARLGCGLGSVASRIHQPREGGWVASVSIVDGPCRVDLTAALGEDGLDFVEGSCAHGPSCSRVIELQRAVLESPAYTQVREDLIHELFQRTLVELSPLDPPPRPQTVPPPEEESDLWPRE